MLPRVLEPETLDHLAPDDPVAQRSRRDLRRVNAFMGARRILARAIARALPEKRAGLRIVEIGCGDGRLMLEVARHRGERWPGARLDLLDRQPLVDAATLAAYAAAGWQARPVVADVIDWAEGDDGERWDLVVANLFLHHFDAASLPRLLAGCARRAEALAACEPRRSRFALAAAHLIFFLGTNAVTRNDGVLSVRAGFIDRELSAAWPGDAAAWRLDEYDDGLFTHCVVAARRPLAS
ncbi:MAG TPA: methyltransferase domain-containing protein [Caldimonas sp.]|jgi:SAM-dependent methyltransferase|nr:methyltransferase domain-containing protein [Caldimonas sp.]